MLCWIIIVKTPGLWIEDSNKMLARVAERVYWAARYLERVENTARLIGVYDKLLFDLPRSVNIGWYNLVIISGAETAFNERYQVRNERNAVKFLLGDAANPSSVVSALKTVRENVRTTRDVVPADTWELVNELSIFLADNIQQGINRSQRYQLLDGIVKGCQQLHGLIYGTMPHDAAWFFMRLGRNLERADMTTRILEAGVSALLQTQDEARLVNSRQIIWGHVLRSLGAEQSYRRTTRSAVNGGKVVHYLLEDPVFPRTIAHCINVLLDSANQLPRSKPVVAHLQQMQQTLFVGVDYSQLAEPLQDYLNDLQLRLAAIHHAISEHWFANV